MFKTDEAYELRVGYNNDIITIDEYYEMLNLLN